MIVNFEFIFDVDFRIDFFGLFDLYIFIYTSVDLSIKWTVLKVDSVVEWIRLLRGIDWYSTDRVT